VRRKAIGAKTQSQTQELLSSTTIEDDTHDRKVLRCCQIFAAPEKLQSQWAGLKTFVQVERSGIRDGQPFQERQFYICNNINSACAANMYRRSFSDNFINSRRLMFLAWTNVYNSFIQERSLLCN
jgi:hypothetical protein